jgi:small subunit ribosomal protein S2
MKDLLECGVHFGHQTRRWNPKMKKFIFGERKNIYIIDLQKTLKYFKYTYNVVRDAAAEGKTFLFVGTKKQAREAIKEHAQKCGMPFVATRWLGGMLTNYPTIKKSIRKLELIEKMEETGQINLLTKKEALMLTRKKEKLLSYLEGYRNVEKTPDFLFVIDAVKEHIAVKEARRMGMKIVAPLDTNCDPDLIDYPIPGNDDAIRSINLFCREMAEAINEGKAIAAEQNGEEVDADAPAAISEEDAAAANVSKEELAEAKEDVEAKTQESAEAKETKKEEAKEPKAKKSEASKDATADDLTKIKGIGKAYQAKLNSEGIYTFEDVANMSQEQIDTMEEKYSFRGDFKESVAHAKELAAAK